MVKQYMHLLSTSSSQIFCAVNFSQDMFPLHYFTSFILIALLYQSNISQQHEQTEQPHLLHSNLCNETCGKFHVPFPFYLTNSCASFSNAFHLSCLNSSALYLNIEAESYKVLEFFSDGVLVTFPGSSTCRQYNDLNSFGFTGNDYFGISVENVIGLYDCEDSSLCKTSCETIDLPGCDGKSNGSPACCYPLSDHSSWDSGDSFSVFSKFGCRGFSSWVVSRGTNSGKRGVKLEWAIPKNISTQVCVSSAEIVNATSVQNGIRCNCQEGFDGDGLISGTGCSKSCIKNGVEAHGPDCCIKKRSRKTVTILAGVLGPVFIIALLIALLCLLKRPVKADAYDSAQSYFHSNISIRKACRTPRMFSYQDLEEATKGFHESQKLADTKNGTIYAGVLGDGSHVAVHKLHCQDEGELIQVLSQIEVLSAVLHRNMAHLLGCCIDRVYTPLVVYEYPANRTLLEHLLQREEKVSLDWNKRLNIAAETSCILAFLQHEISPPICHHNLESGCLFLDDELSVKIAGFGLVKPSIQNKSHSHGTHQDSSIHKSDVYDFGVLLLELITGSKHKVLPATALQKIRGGKLEEIVDPSLYYHEQPQFRREQIDVVADLATRCLLFGGDGKIGIIEVARELIHITKESIDGGSKRGPALEETFSNSSLLQMISMSPDSIYVP